MSALVDLAREIATEAHAGQLGKGGEPYIEHPEAVAATLRADGYDDRTVAVALLHDAIEDSGLTVQDLIWRGIPEEVTVAVQLLSKPNGMRYREYVGALILTGNLLAIRVKHADVGHNLERTRALPDDHKDKARLLDKYEPAHRLLSEIVEDR
jgi:(p)ppGpp synthase/HD superfamily hydrolase